MTRTTHSISDKMFIERLIIFTFLLLVTTFTTYGQNPGGVAGAGVWTKADKGLQTINAVLANVPAGSRTSNGYCCNLPESLSTLSSPQAWSGNTAAAGWYLTLDMGADQSVTGVATKGRGDVANWVTSYTLKYATDAAPTTFITIGGTFTANYDQNTLVYNTFAPVNARYIRITETGFSGYPSMRADLVKTSSVGTPNSSGSIISAWSNLAVPANSFQARATPTYKIEGPNFNPTVNFSGSDFFQSASDYPSNSPGKYTKFAVFFPTTNGPSNIISTDNSAGPALFAPNYNLTMYHSANIGTVSPISSTRSSLGTAVFSTGTPNGTFLKVDGKAGTLATSSQSYSAGKVQLGAFNSGSNLIGTISESIIYNTNLSAQDINRVESYLGLKYGITLGHNYVASNNTTTVFSLNTYINNIAGIGRDDNSELYQRQSQSISTGIGQILMSLGSPKSTNLGNVSSFTFNNSFLVWGDNGLSGTTSLAGFTGTTSKLQRLWKVTSTNMTQTVRLMYPKNDISLLNPVLITSSDPTIAAGDVVTNLSTTTFNGSDYYYADVTWNGSDSYFTFAGNSVAPASISTGLGWWYKGDAGIIKSGSDVSSWVNQSANSGLNVAATSPNRMPKAIDFQNYNPVVSFDGTDDVLRSATGFWKAAANNTKYNIYSVVATSNYNNSIANPSFTETNLLGTQTMFLPYNNNISNGIWPNNVTSVPINGYNNFTPYLWSSRYVASSNPKVNEIRNNGNVIATSTNASGFNGNNSPLDIGGSQTNDWYLKGNIGEILMYNIDNTPIQRQQIESYLALKWGISLNQTTATDYLASDGTTKMWTAATGGTFKNNIAGIGRDDASGLYQKQSKSINDFNTPAMGIDTIAMTNADNVNVIDDKNFLSWANDDGALMLSTSPVPSGTTITQWLARKWQVQETGIVGSTQLFAYTTGLPAGGAVYLLVADDAAFTNGVEEIPMTAQGAKWMVNYDFNGVKYFTFGKKAIPEICYNGIDDDQDGVVDNGCAPQPPAPCTGSASNIANFGIRQEWQNTDVLLGCSSSPTVADLDGDGIAELIANNAGGTGISVFKGDGSSYKTNAYSLPLRIIVGQSTNMTAVADIDGDGIPEVINIGLDKYVYVFNNVSGSSTDYKFRSATVIQTAFIGASVRVSDLDEDGIPELIIGLDVFKFNLAAGTLTKVIAGTASNPSGKDTEIWGNDIVCIDIIPTSPGKEIVAGSKVYFPDMVTGTLTVLKNLNIIAPADVPNNDDGPTAVADVDLDGNLDIVYPNGTNLIVWDPVTEVLKAKLAYVNSGKKDAGMPTIAEVYDEKTNDGKAKNYPEIIFTAIRKLYAFNMNNLTAPVWMLTTTDRSGRTGVTSFDLNNDGVAEIIYNDETTIRVINGNNTVPGTGGNPPSPVNLFTFPSGTATWMENPVVADVDGDGAVEFVCVSLGDYALSGYLRVFGSATGTTPWQPGRNIWNQRGYRSSNINDNFSIPRIERNTTLDYPVGSLRYEYNVYNKQVNTSLLPIGIVAQPDAVAGTVGLTPDNCGAANATSITYTLLNTGSAALPAGTPVRFYVGNPLTGPATILAEVNTLNTSVPAGGSGTEQVTLNLSGIALPFDLYILINDDGSKAVPVSLPIGSTNIGECNYTNNVASVNITELGNQKPFLTVESAVCNGATYDVRFSSNGVVASNYGVVSSNIVTGIPAGTDVVLTGLNGNGCVATTVFVKGPADCTTAPAGCLPPRLTAGQGVCNGATYNAAVSYATGATITVSPASVSFSGNTLTAPTGINATVTATLGSCTSVLTIAAPIDCRPCITPSVSFSGGICNGTTYSLAINNPSSTSIAFSPAVGTLSANSLTGVPLGTDITFTVSPVGCEVATITIKAPTTTLVKPKLAANTSSILAPLQDCLTADGYFQFVNDPNSPIDKYMAIRPNLVTGYNFGSGITAMNNNPSVNNQVKTATDGNNNVNAITGLANRMYTVSYSGTLALNGSSFVVRLYYATSDIQAAEDAVAAQNQMTPVAGGIVRSQWFKYEGTASDAIANQVGDFRGFANSSLVRYLVPSATGVENGINYVEFDNITSFSTFGYLAAFNNTGVLPVKLTSFKGRVAACSAVLSWATSNEAGTKSYSLQHSTDGHDYKTIATIDSKNNPTGSMYSYTYPDLAGGTNIFRLMMVDKDGSFEYSQNVKLTSNCASQLSVVVSPNPTTAMVKLSGLPARSRIQVISPLGQRIMTFESTRSSASIDLGGLASGVYLIRVVGDDGSTQNVSVVKN